MFEFTCYKCNEKFHVQFENLYNKISIVCPNCGNPLPQKTVEHLRKLSDAYMDVIDSLYHTNDFGSAWGIRVLETKESMPRNPDQYFDRKPSEDESIWKSRQKPYIPPKDNPEIMTDDDLPF
jgi:transcription elongation factor Elf1